MKLKARYPVFVERAEMVRHRSPKPLLYMAETAVDIAELASRDVPIALSVGRMEKDGKPGRVVDIRFNGGHFYWRCYTPITELVAILDERPLEGFGPLASNLFAQAANSGSAMNKTNPKGLVKAILDRRNISHYRDFYLEGPKLSAPINEMDRIERARADFHTAVEAFVLVDGELWIECPEPMLAVDIHNRPGRIRLVTPPMQPDTIEFAEYDRGNLGEVTFTVGMEAEARALAREAFDPETPWRESEFHLDVLMPQVFSQDVPYGDVIHHLRRCSREARLPDSLKGRIGEFLHGGDLSEECVREFVESIQDLIPEVVRWTVKAIRYQLHRYDAEPISVPMAMVPHFGK